MKCSDIRDADGTKSYRRRGVMQLIDSLEIGGAERVAVNMANELSQNQFRCHLCSTRREGPLSWDVSNHVGRLRLDRQRTLEWSAIRKLTAYVRTHDIDILHAHSTSLLTGFLASIMPPHPILIWHDHYGFGDTRPRPAFPYNVLARRAKAVISVNSSLARWTRDALHIEPERIHIIYNFVSPPSTNSKTEGLPGRAGKRIASVANLKPQKDHVTLVEAMNLVVQKVPDAHLLVVGNVNDEDYAEKVRERINQLNLSSNITLLGKQENVFGILRECDIGVLSSLSEGLPLAILEYGMAGLPVVSTTAGQCPDVLDDGKAGLLVAPANARQLAESLVLLLKSKEERDTLGAALHKRVNSEFSETKALQQLEEIYRTVLKCKYDSVDCAAAG